MPDDLIRIQPAGELRRQFAAWATAQVPKLRTVSQAEFGVPTWLYTEMPEHLLLGALIDGHPYRPIDDGQVPPGEHQSEGMAAIGAVDGREPTVEDVAAAHNGTTADREQWLAVTVSGQETSPAPTPEGQGQGEQTQVVCPVGGCGREFRSERALRTHSRQAHPQASAQSGS